MTHEELNQILDNAETALNNGNYDFAEQMSNEVLNQLKDETDAVFVRFLARTFLLLGYVAQRKGNFSLAIERLSKALEQYVSVEDKQEVANTLQKIGTMYGQFSDLTHSLEYLEKALLLDEELGNKAGVATVTGNIGLVYHGLSDYTRALEYLRKALSLDEELGHKEGVARHLGNIGFVYGDLSDYPLALEYFGKSLSLDEELGNKANVAKVNGNIGLVYRVLSDYPRALEYFGKALALDEELGNKAGVARHLGNIGTMYGDLSDYPRTLEYLEKSLALDEELGNKAGVATVTGNIGIVYRLLSDYTRALEYYGKALALDEQIGNKAGVARHLGNIGIVYGNLSDYPRALEYLGKALSINEELGNKAGTASINGNIGHLYADEKFEGYDFSKAEEYLLKTIAMFEEIGVIKDLYENHQLLANLYEKQERWQEFAVQYKKFRELEKEVLSEETKKSVDRFEVQMLMKEKEIERLKNVELARANEELVKLNSEKNEFLGIAAHDLKNPLAAITTSIGILERYGSRMTSGEVTEKYSEIKRTSKRMLDIITNLLDINAIERGAITFKPEFFNLSETVQEVVDSNRQRAGEKSISIFFDLVPESAEITADRQIVSQIIDNLVSNAVKYSPQNKNVWVNVESNVKSVKISVRDEGPGLSSEDIEKLFGRFQRLSAKPTGGEHSTGLGLSIVKKLVEAMNGKVWCESELGKGATFIVELPKE